MGTSPLNALPEDTRRAAAELHALNFPYLAIGDQVDAFIQDIPWDAMRMTDEEPAGQLAMLALINLFQYQENLSDNLAALATGLRLDWKYALHLPLAYPGIEPDGLCAFRRRMLTNPPAFQAFGQLTEQCGQLGLFHGNISPDPSDVIEVNCLKNCLDRTINTLLPALEVLASEQPTWLKKVALPHWYTRYISLHKQLLQVNSQEELLSMLRSILQDMRYLAGAIQSQPNLLLKGYPEIAEFLHLWNEMDKGTPNHSSHRQSNTFQAVECTAHCHHHNMQHLSNL